MKHRIKILLLASMVSIVFGVSGSFAYAAEESGSIGVEGRISSPPPTVGATITVPQDGQVFTALPVTVAGICPNGLLVKVFKNNVFAGSVQCSGGSFSIVIDLFSGLNELVARVYDDLDQAGPDSNLVRVTLNDGRPGAGSRVSLTSNFAKRGANPGQTLTWPIILAGGQGPYAITVDWGDGKPVDLFSREFPGTFDIEHIYDNPGIYNIVIKAVDQNGGVAYLQLVGVGNGPLSQESGGAGSGDGDAPQVKILWQPAAIMIPLIISTFWLGKRYELRVIRKRLEHGDRPF
jgi:hypothetical protein